MEEREFKMFQVACVTLVFVCWYKARQSNFPTGTEKHTGLCLVFHYKDQEGMMMTVLLGYGPSCIVPCKVFLHPVMLKLHEKLE